MVQAALQQKISDYVGRGYTVAAQSANNATLLKPKRIGIGWAILWFLLAGIGVLVYFAYHMWGKKQEQVFLSVDDKGTVSIATSNI
jgi:ABC-type Fe3+ transport system permease subunit